MKENQMNIPDRDLNRIKELCCVLRIAEYAYYNTSVCFIDNEAYDSLKLELRELLNNNLKVNIDGCCISKNNEYNIILTSTHGIGCYEKPIKEIIDEIQNGFAISACEWVAFEVQKKLQKKVERYTDFPGISLRLLQPKTNNGLPITITIYPIDEKTVWLSGFSFEPNFLLTPEDALKCILEL